MNLRVRAISVPIYFNSTLTDFFDVALQTVASKHLLRQQDSQRIDEEAGMDNINLEESELEFAALQLSGEHPNGNTQVPALCAICLCSYELDDSVTYSPNRACRHAFHTECISTWITKKETPLCPCCRQEFCSLD